MGTCWVYPPASPGGAWPLGQLSAKIRADDVLPERGGGKLSLCKSHLCFVMPPGHT